MLSFNESLKILKDTNAFLEGHFILSSGLHTNQYVQCAKLLSHPKKAEIICKSLSAKIKESYNNIDLILSPAIGGIVVGYEIGRQLNIKTIFAERENNELKLRRGFTIKEKSNVLIVEDVITTGKSVMECNKLIQKNNSNLIGYACIVDRSGKNLEIKNKIVSQLKIDLKSYKAESLPDYLKKIPATKPGSRNI